MSNTYGQQYAEGQGAGIDVDRPLQPDTALDGDKLSRGGFAAIAASALRKVSGSAGFVLSVEGSWGSGKSSVLAMIQALLEKGKGEPSPVIVHFNPWLVGEKDALLRQFLSTIANTIDQGDSARDGKKVAKELKAYAKVFDLVKLIPGAEPWASMVKSVVEAAGDATESVSEYKTPNIETYKQKVETALKEFERPVIVFIDDIDRLFPAEVFEMIRIIKAVGELPSVGYVVAWDSAYVSEALKNLNVPQSDSYLDKIVQVRMPLPNLSLAARRALFTDGMDSMDPEALREYFIGQDQRVGLLYHSGLRDLLDQPRDVVRVFNAVRLMEPLLRGEIVFADILGLAALSVKAPAVFELIKRKPRIFVGRVAGDGPEPAEITKTIANGGTERRRAYDAGPALAAEKVVHFLFPSVAVAEDGLSFGSGSYADGAISHGSRLAIALQLSLADEDVSIKAARQFLHHPSEREQIVSQLTTNNCYDFIDMLGELGFSSPPQDPEMLLNSCVAIARLPDEPVYVVRSEARQQQFHFRVEELALNKIRSIALDEEFADLVFQGIVADHQALTCAAVILARNYLRRADASGGFRSSATRQLLIDRFAANVLRAASGQVLLRQNRVSLIFRVLAQLAPQTCPKVFETLKGNDPTLDEFASHLLRDGWDSDNGQAYALPEDESLITAYCSMHEFKAHAKRRVQDPAIGYPALAAWRCVVEGNRLYGADGSEVELDV